VGEGRVHRYIAREGPDEGRRGVEKIRRRRQQEEEEAQEVYTYKSAVDRQAPAEAMYACTVLYMDY
jgi:hypothetical protein